MGGARCGECTHPLPSLLAPWLAAECPQGGADVFGCLALCSDPATTSLLPTFPHHCSKIDLFDRQSGRAPPHPTPRPPAPPTQHPPIPHYSTVELYDPQKDCWSSGPIMPAPCSFAAAAMLGSQVSPPLCAAVVGREGG